MSVKSIGQDSRLERALSLEIVRVTERAAVAAARLRGRGAEKKSDQAAVDAMRRELSGLADVDAGFLRQRAAKMGIKDPRRKYQIEDMVKGECLFAATGVTDGRMLRGVQFGRDVIETDTVVMRSTSGTIRWIRAEHRLLDKFK
jgi:fructose-1,6-bisphosphatase II / sedoheptulose-1,7-bisphosphatase